MKFLENYPIRNHMLDVVGHHRRAARQKVDPKIRIRQGCKGDSLWRLRGRGVDLRFQVLQCPRLKSRNWVATALRLSRELGLRFPPIQ
jgi:hypothetical protein